MIAAVFPGQGSQKRSMGRELYESNDAARKVFDQVQSATGIDIATLCFESDEETLRRTENAQLALYTCSLAAFQAFPKSNFQATAGHSVGEYAGLAAAEVLSLEDGARLVQRRGDIMARSGNLREGAMSAILGLERGALEEVCRNASATEEVAVIANDNCPGQLVISGDKTAIERAEELAKEAGAKRALRLNVSGAFHSPLMEEAARSMALALRPELFHPSSGPKVYANVTSEPVDQESQWPNLLEQQLRGTVRWTETIERMSASGIDIFIEFGAGEVLSGLIRRTNNEARTFAVYDNQTLERCLNELNAAGVQA